MDLVGIYINGLLMGFGVGGVLALIIVVAGYVRQAPELT